MISDEIPVAGRVDFIGGVKGYRGDSLCDLKTGKVRPSHWLQLAAYKASYKGDCKRRLIIAVKNGKVRVIPSDKKNPTVDNTSGRDWVIYKHMFEVFLWVNKLLEVK